MINEALLLVVDGKPVQMPAEEFGRDGVVCEILSQFRLDPDTWYDTVRRFVMCRGSWTYKSCFAGTATVMALYAVS